MRLPVLVLGLHRREVRKLIFKPHAGRLDARKWAVLGFVGSCLRKIVNVLEKEDGPTFVLEENPTGKREFVGLA